MPYNPYTEREINLMVNRQAMKWRAESKKYFKFVTFHHWLHNVIMDWYEPFRYMGMYALLLYIKIMYGKKIQNKYATVDMKFWMRWFRFKVRDSLIEMKDAREFIHRNRSVLPNLTFTADLDLKLEKVLKQ